MAGNNIRIYGDKPPDKVQSIRRNENSERGIKHIVSLLLWRGTKPQLYLSRILSCCGILAPFVIAAFVIIAGGLTPDYNQLTDTISSLCDQASNTPELMTTGFIIYGVLIIGFAYAFHLRLRHGNRVRIAWVALTLYGICMILAGIFRDSPGALNTEGILHNTAIITSCLSVLIGMWMFASSVYKKRSWSGFTWFTLIASFLGLVLSIIFLVQSYVPLAGLLQRFFYCIILIWIETVAIWLFRLSFKQ